MNEKQIVAHRQGAANINCSTKLFLSLLRAVKCSKTNALLKTKRPSNLGLLSKGGGGGGGAFIDSKFYQLQNVISHPIFVVCTYCFRFSTSLDALYLKQ